MWVQHILKLELKMTPSTAAQQERIGVGRVLMHLLQILGAWPIFSERHHQNARSTQCRTWLARNYRYLLHGPLTFTYNTLFWVEALTRWERADHILYMSITEVGMMALTVNFWRLEQRACLFMHELTYSDHLALRNQAERQWWRAKQRSFTRVVVCYIGGGASVLCTVFGAPLLVNGYFLPYDYWLPFEWHNAQNYWYAYSYEVVAMSLTCIANVTMHMMLCYYLFHVALLYKLIGMRLMALQHLSERLAVQQLINIIELHKRVKRLTAQCEVLVSLPILVQLVLSVFILCLTAYGLQSMQINENPGQYFAMLQFASLQTLQIFLPCYFANEITINSDALTTCVYSSNWQEFSPPTRKLMNLYMELMRRPEQIKAGNYFLVGLPIFTKTMNHAYSLLAMLLNMSK